MDEEFNNGVPYSGIVPTYFLRKCKTEREIAEYIDAQLRGVKAGLIIQWERWREQHGLQR